MSKRSNLAIDYNDLQNGDTFRDKCPFCNANEKSFVITKVNNGLLYNCFRATCSASGFVSTRNGEVFKENKNKVWRPNPYTKLYTSNFPLDITEYIQQKYHLSYIPRTWRWNAEDNELVMPLYTEQHTFWGEQAKKFKPKPNEQKVKTYAELEFKPRLHFPLHATNSNPNYYIVEDPISAERIKQNGNRVVALLGTVFNDTKAMHLRNIGIKDLIFCLDKDAWKKAVEFKRQYEALFNSIQIRVWFSGKDVKDMDQQEFHEVIT